MINSLANVNKQSIFTQKNNEKKHTLNFVFLSPALFSTSTFIYFPCYFENTAHNTIPIYHLTTTKTPSIIFILLSDKNFAADFICEVSPFLLDFCRQTKSIQLWAKVYILADSNIIFTDFPENKFYHEQPYNSLHLFALLIITFCQNRHTSKNILIFLYICPRNKLLF